MFSKDNFDVLLEHCYWDHMIELFLAQVYKGLSFFFHWAKEARYLSGEKPIYQINTPIQITYGHSSILYQEKE